VELAPDAERHHHPGTSVEISFFASLSIGKRYTRTCVSFTSM
jgi:hypothetical protein